MYQVLARKYRPRNFNELVGQNHVSRALTSTLERGRLHHAYLFTGTRGVGKTTIARILAKCLNCETGVTSMPCEVCATCRAVNEGRFIDLIEIDAASRTKVEDTRELLDNVPYAPTQGRFKVYLIDEVHMLSTHSFNALLKTLEEPPEHVKFLFATTDPQKLPITVISRCLQFTLRPLAVDEITTHLTEILAKEQIQTEQDALWQIAEAAQGSLRDALSLTDQAIAYGQGQVQHRDVKEMLGLIDRSIIYDLILAIHQNQQAHVSQLLLQFRQQALDVSLVLDQLITTLHELALLQYLPDLALKYSNEINQKIMQLSQRISAQDLQLYYQVACKGRAELQLAVTQEQGFEMCVLRLLAFRPLQANERIVSPINSAQTTEQLQNHVIAQPHVSLEHVEQHYTEEKNHHEKTQTEQNQEIVLKQDVGLQHDVISNDRPQEMAQESVVHAVTSASPIIQKTPELTPPQRDILATELDTSTLLTFDLAQSDGLLGLDAVVAQTTTHPIDAFEKQGILQSQDMEFPLDEMQNTVISGEHSHVEAGISEVDFSLSNTQAENSELASTTHQTTTLIAQERVVEKPILESEQSSLMVQKVLDQRMPQEILKLVEQDLTGDWTLHKWEYWFRNSQLSPAIQELAQHGQMLGQLDGKSILHLPPQYESLFQAVAPVVEQALQTVWPNTHLQVKYEALTGQTPQHLNQQRKAEAYQCAVNLLEQDVHIAGLIHAFDAQLEYIQLK